MTPELKKELLKATHSRELLQIEHIQDLWSGYGTLNRIKLDTGSVILKLINFPDESNHPRGWNSNMSHKRKEKSYQVEMNWYESYNSGIPNALSPRLIAKGPNWFVLEDLKEKGFAPKRSIDEDGIKLCLKWLAHFHSYYMNQKPEGLWTIGTYWHLETRPEELEVLDDLELKEAAPKIDQVLNSAKHQTFVHGDAKLANFLFNGEEASAVDFQYVGGGVGIKDVAYFLSSIFEEEDLQEHEEWCLDYYFSELNDKEVEKEWRKLYPYAWSDFYRFLKGWSPGHWKIHSYSEQMKDKVLKWL